MTTWQRIKELRKERGLSQSQLAEMVGYTDRTSIAKVEAGRVDLSESKIAAFAKALGVSPADLMGFGLRQVELNADEERLVTLYRLTDEFERRLIWDVLARYEKNTARSSVS